jgi:Flp pilus assembly pilin Flp
MKKRRQSLIEDERGGYQVEYTIVLVLVAVIAGAAIAGLSIPLIQYYRSIQTMIVSPAP